MTKFASFRYRLLAWSLEIQLEFLLYSAFLMYLAGSENLQGFVSSFMLFLVLFLVPWMILNLFYHAYFTVWFGGPLGKILTGLQVVDEKGKPLSLRRSLFRHSIGYTFSSTLFGLGFWSVIKDERSRAWHDKAAGSQVIVAKNLWPLALVLVAILLFLNIFFISSSITKLVSGPVGTEITNLVKTFQEEQKQPALPQKEEPAPLPQAKAL